MSRDRHADLQEQLNAARLERDELQQALASPGVLSDPRQLRDKSQRLAELEALLGLGERYEAVANDLAEATELLTAERADSELVALAAEEVRRLEPQLVQLERELWQALAPEDPRNRRSAILEIRAGTGGEEAALFARELFRMYSRYVERRGWRMELLDLSESDLGGLKEVVALVEGQGVFGRLRYEAGIHRVQRVPETEASGRRHTSAVTVAVLPEAEEVEIELHEKDLRIDRFCASGPGGQGVNTTYSAVRITHLPTGLVVTCQDERSQIKNREKALRVLRSRLLERELAERQGAVAEERRRMVGSGDRSEKIRTYNFPQHRVTDHRVGLTLYRLSEILDGALDELIEPVAEQLALVAGREG